ncbi:MAG TPA: hypothetical protein VGV14_10525 [Rhodanobacter sp.]|nr:hypothetical protein [Rhodanobacter sp.]
MSVRTITAIVDGTQKTFAGRAAWALDQLLTAGEDGCTPIDNPAPRWAHYVFLIRRDGVNVETVTEPHGGAYSGHHARYVLRSNVSVIDREAA